MAINYENHNTFYNQAQDYFIDDLKQHQSKQNDCKNENYIRPSAPSDCSSLKDQALAEDDVSVGGDSSDASIDAVNCDDGSSVRYTILYILYNIAPVYWRIVDIFKDNHWSWDEHDANDDSETEEESDYTDASGITSSGEDDAEDSEVSKNENDDEKLIPEEDLRFVTKIKYLVRLMKLWFIAVLNKKLLLGIISLQLKTMPIQVDTILVD